MKKFPELSKEVAYHADDYNSIDNTDIHYLIKKAEVLDSKKYRLCMHESNNNPIHEMFIVHPQDMYIRPHKHNNKPESLLVISGEAEYIIFNDSGEIEDLIPLSVINGNGKFYVRLNKNLYHSLNIHSKWFTFLEITKGPFIREDTIFPEWAPDSEDIVKVTKYMSQLNRNLKMYNLNR